MTTGLCLGFLILCLGGVVWKFVKKYDNGGGE